MARRPGGMTFKGKALNPSAAALDRYSTALTGMVDTMTAAVNAATRELYATRGPHLTATVAMDASMSSQARILMNALAARFNAFFGRLAPDLATKMTNDVDRSSATSLHASLEDVTGGLSLNTSVITGPIADATKAAIAANVALIKSIPQKYLTDVQGEVFRSIQEGQGLHDVLGHVERLGVVTRKRAKLIAKDQTSKATTAINAARMKALGIRKFEWLHSRGDKEPRPLHLNVLNRRVFSFDDPPIIDEATGERGLPGQLINCSCRMIPVIDFGGDDEQADSAQGGRQRVVFR